MLIWLLPLSSALGFINNMNLSFADAANVFFGVLAWQNGKHQHFVLIVIAKTCHAMTQPSTRPFSSWINSSVHMPNQFTFDHNAMFIYIHLQIHGDKWWRWGGREERVKWNVHHKKFIELVRTGMARLHSNMWRYKHVTMNIEKGNDQFI